VEDGGLTRTDVHQLEYRFGIRIVPGNALSGGVHSPRKAKGSGYETSFFIVTKQHPEALRAEIEGLGHQEQLYLD